MKTTQLFSIVLLCLFSSICVGQNCKKFKKGIKRAKKHFPDKEIVYATKQRSLFSKFSHAVATYLVKAESSNYLAIVFVREFGRRIDLLDANPISFQFENNEILTLYPEKSSFGKFTLPATTEINHQFYSVSTEQLEQLSAQQITHVKIYFSSEKVPVEKRSEDDIGLFFDYEILSNRYKSNLMEPASCLLSNQ